MRVRSLLLIHCAVTYANDAILRSLDPVPVLHFPLHRRNGPFTSTIFPTDSADLEYLQAELERAEGRFNRTKREVKGNRLVRKPKEVSSPDVDAGHLLGDIATNGTWYTIMQIGDPVQTIEVDLNMLMSDFYVVITSSTLGSRYDDLFSQSHVKSNKHPYPRCSLPTDTFTLPTINASIPLSFAYCRPSKSSGATLGPSGSTLGLAPSEHLSQTGAVSILKQLIDKDTIRRPNFSLMLINSEKGVLSVGGTAASAVKRVISEIRGVLDKLGESTDEETVLKAETGALTKREEGWKEPEANGDGWQSEWTWSKTQGADGWWQVLMQSVFIDSTRALKNQQVVIDINTPFVLAPPLAAKSFYASVSGSTQLPPPYSSFYTFPCLNPPQIAFEFGGKKFPFLHSPRGQFGDWRGGLPGGRFSLGRLRPGSGYCIGAVVETRLGLRDEQSEILDEGRRGTRAGSEQKDLGGNGMKDVWVIGEGFLRGVGMTFDFKDDKVGFRKY